MIERTFSSAKLGHRRATYSDCEQYRYSLVINWSTAASLLFIGLNPSTATERDNDPTVAKCIRLARQWEYGGMVMSNLFAYRSTDPEGMKAHPEPIGPENTVPFLYSLATSGKAIACWGKHGNHLDRGEWVARGLCDLGLNLYCLATNNDDTPKHPLYLPEKYLVPIPWRSALVTR